MIKITSLRKLGINLVGGIFVEEGRPERILLDICNRNGHGYVRGIGFFEFSRLGIVFVDDWICVAGNRDFRILQKHDWIADIHNDRRGDLVD